MVKSILIGAVLGTSLFALSIPLNRRRFGILAFGIESLIALLIPGAAAFLLFPLLVLVLLFLPTAQGGGRTQPQMYCVLTSTSGPLTGREYHIQQNQTLRIGREDFCEVQFPDGTPGIGHFHCEVSFENGMAILKDERSRYGTFLLPSAQRVSPDEPVRLEDNAAFCLASPAAAFQVHYTYS